MTWAEFNEEVRVYLTVHNRRQGSVQDLIDQTIRAGAIDLQVYVPDYKEGHEDTFEASDLIDGGFVMAGDLPGGRIKSARIVRLDPDTAEEDENAFIALRPTGLESLNPLRAGMAAEGAGYLVLDTVNDRFWISPPLNAESVLKVEWTGIKSEFEDDDTVRFDSRCAQCVSEYVLSRLALIVDKDAALAQAHGRLHVGLRRSIFAERQARKHVEQTENSNQLEQDVAYPEE